MKRALTITKSGDRDLVMTREFDAPRKLVYDAHTKPDLVRRWLLGPPGWTMPVCDMDVRVGGTYRWVWRKETDGSEMGMGGVYREVKAPERLVTTERFDEAWYPGESLNTLVLIEQGGRTTLTQTMRYESPAAREAVIKSGMEKGVEASYDRLADVLAASAATQR
ncbi:MAG TPA: SRPBCC family protein [Gemmatimonadales bacterium]|nr:SRPBCC family protein [Gemmatimonadales bacterium]